MPSRRTFLKGAVMALGDRILLPRRVWSGAPDPALLASLPGKQPLIRKTYRPPNYETPVAYFDSPFTPNTRFFVRYHLPAIPEVRLAQWKLKIGGAAAGRPLEFTLDELRENFEMAEIPALCQCAGNRRGLLPSRVPGVQWGHGAMGNALWKGIRLRDVLGRAGLKKEALEVVFSGADSGVLAKTPDFAKSLPLAKALDAHTLIAFAMNGEPLPHWNGFPARLVVPGWSGTYWVKHLTAIDVVDKPFDGFWMQAAYRMPKGKFPPGDRFPSQETGADAPVTELPVNSMITYPAEGQSFRKDQPITAKGVAWDGGHGLERVEVSLDNGQTWHPGTLGTDYGPHAWRQWSYRFTPTRTGSIGLMVRAGNAIGHGQPEKPIANRAGYHNNAVQGIVIDVT